MNDSSIETCPFCADAIAADTFLETPRFRAVYNVAPILPGHSLIIPKRHVDSFLALSDDECSEMALFSRKVVKLLLPVFNAQSFNWTIQEGAEAGQSISHMHLHVIPRLPGDLPAPGDWYPLLKHWEHETIDSEQRPRLSAPERQEIVNQLRAAAART
jgi:bis(5'-adenosyl)-triphosphatase